MRPSTTKRWKSRTFGHLAGRLCTSWALVLLWTAAGILTPQIGSQEAHAQDSFDDDDGSFEAGERFYNLGVRYTKFKGYTKALAFYRKALPFMNEDPGLYFNMVGVVEALGKSSQIYLYAGAFLRLEPDGPDSREVNYKYIRAGSTLKASRRAPADVRFDIEPKGVPLYVNMIPVGESGGPPVSLPPGSYTVTGTLDDHHPFEKTIRVSPRTPMTVPGAFEKIKYYGHLQVKVFEAPCAWPCTALQAAVNQDDKEKSGLEVAKGVKVFVNDTQVGKTPMDKLKLLADRYLVRFERKGWDSWSRYVTIPRNSTFELHPILEKTPSE